MKLKKIFICLAAVIMLLSALTVNVFAANPTVTCGTKSVSLDKLNVGDTMEIEITLSDAPELNSILFSKFTYDKTTLELVEGSFAKSGQLSWGIGEDELEPDTMASSFIKKQNLNGAVATLKFKVIGKSAGSYDISFLINASYNDEQGNNVPVELALTSGKIEITCPHTNKTAVAEVPATCKTEGTKAHEKCSDCSALILNGKEVTEAELKTDKDLTNHEGDTEIRDAKEATEYEEGYTGDTYCLSCNTKIADGKAIPKLDHTHDMTHNEAVAPTCTEDGVLENWYCTKCKNYYADEKGTEKLESIVDPKLGHKTELKDAKEATCTEPGYTGDEVCTVCGVTVTKGEEIPAKGHSYGEKLKFDAENHWFECEVCGDVKDKAAHELELVVVTPAEGDKDGACHDKCTKCDYVSEDRPLKHEHAIEEVAESAATCVTPKIKAHYTCTICHKLFSDDKGENEVTKESLYDGDVDLTNHVGGTKEEGAVEPTCVAPGKEADTVCVSCGTVIENGKELPATGEHTFEWKTDKEPTFEETGLKHEECTVCGLKQNENTVIEKKDCEHAAMEHHAEVAATCSKSGTKEYWHCTVCNRDYTDEKGTLKVENPEDLVIPSGNSNNHVNTKIINYKAATCVSEGYTGDTYCNDCQKTVSTGSTTPVDPNAHSFLYGKCQLCGYTRIIYDAPTYVDDANHFSGGVLAHHVPDSMVMHTDGEYEWHYCLYCKHEYGKVRVVEIEDSVDLIVDDPVQSGDDEPVPDDIPVTDNEPETTEPVKDNNPPTGIAVALLPMALAALAAIASKKTK